jgi:hypothetical protein
MEEKKGKLRMPSVIARAGRETRKWFMAGFFDADGDTPEVEGARFRPRMRVKQASLEIPNDIKSPLRRYADSTLRPHRESGGAWGISSEKLNSRKILFSHAIDTSYKELAVGMHAKYFKPRHKI